MSETPQQTEYFGVARWHAWAPGVGDGPAWKKWIADGDCPEPDAKPDVSYLPPLLRRRLDRCGRMALATAWPCAEGRESVRFVFGSRHGSLDRTLQLLTALAREEALSPTDFSLSVHNSIAGLYSIARGDRAAATALAAGGDTLGMALLEGAAMIAEGAGVVLVCYADDRVPPPYDSFVEADSRRHPFSISLLLTPPEDAALRCRLIQDGVGPAELPEAALMRFLTEGAPTCVLGVDQPWRLSREPVHAG
ncbi:MAG: beta-ketoacyl synthase chain length factor [Bacillota bacterium]